MDIETLANVGEAIGGLGVVISLLYLAVQIRQNTRPGPLSRRLLAAIERFPSGSV